MAGGPEHPRARTVPPKGDLYFLFRGEGLNQTGDIVRRAFTARRYCHVARKRHVIAACFCGFRLLSILCLVFLAGCGNGKSPDSASSKYTPHDAIYLAGETENESYLKISSNIEGEAAVSVTNGGHLTLSDATIWKIGGEASGSPTYGMEGIKGYPPPEDWDLESPSEAGASSPPPPEDGVEPDAGMPEEVLPGGPTPLGVETEDANPGPGATHAGVFAGSGGTVSLENVCIETAIGEGSGIYASGEGSLITLKNGTITTDGSTAHGVFATHKGTVAVENVTIITRGEHSSALATYQGNGVVTAVGGTYTAFGEYSAGIYSASDISVTDVVCKSVLDNAAVVEGGSSITLKNSVLWAREKGGVMIYQSFTDEAPDGASRFEMIGGSISADDGPIFYVTNTSGSVFLKHVDLFGPSGILLKVLKGEWGVDIAWSKPIRGGTVTLVAENQTLPGDVIVDEFSEIDMILKDGTTLTGAIDTDNHGKNVHLTLDATSTWYITADSYLTKLTFYDGIPDTGITNIIGDGHSVFYDEEASPALGGKIYDLPNGGKLMPKPH